MVAECSSEKAATPVTLSISPSSLALATGATVQITATTNDAAGVNWTATSGTVQANGNYTAPTGTQSTTATITATSKSDPTKSASASAIIVAPGQVTPTANAQVALYTVSPPLSANVSVQFGLDTNYGLTTWQQPTPSGGGAVSLFVAGMRAGTTYHVRGVLKFADGSQFMDADQTFKTGDLTAAKLPSLTATTTAGMTPQAGVELLALLCGTTATGTFPVAVTDLGGNLIWAYDPGFTNIQINPVKLLLNGHFLMNFSGTSPDGMGSILREVDLSGATVWEMTAAQLNQALAAATCAGCNITVVGTHHDFVMLPNGHLIVLAAQQQTISGTVVTGDVLIDLDTNRKPVWLWNEFDHLDVNRRPFQFPDWTHTNAVIYSPDDGNLIISIRHQNWLVKIDYANGAGAGDILWHLGYQGDFALQGGTDPTDWFYAQHGPHFATPNTTGKFRLVLFDNGDDRVFATGVTCGTTGQPPCLYSTVPVIEIDESAKTAKLIINPRAPVYSFFGGNAEVLANGNVEFAESASSSGTTGDIFEILQDAGAEPVWQLHVNGQFAYRGERMPSLYPGVQW